MKMIKIKKVLLTTALILLLTPMCHAQVSNPVEAGVYSPNGNVFIEGKLDADEMTSPYVTILLSDGENVGFIRQVNVNDDGSYALKFKNVVDINGYALSVREGSRDLNSTVTLSEVKTSLPVVTVSLCNDKNDWYFPTGSELAAELDIEAKYADSACTFDVIAAFYTEDNALIGCSSVNMGISGDYKETKSTKIENVPENCAKVKAFVWTSITTAIPLSKTDLAEFDKYIFGTEQEEMTIAFVGDSITHNPDSYKSTVEHFYMTRYPDRKITFVNKGIGGNDSADVLARFDWDVMDCEGKKPDAALVMLGHNDVGKSYYDDIADNGRDWHYNRFIQYYPELINKFIENDIPVVVISPTVYDEWDDPALTGVNYSCEEIGANRTGLTRFTEFIKSFAETEKLQYIPMHETTTAITAELRAENPEIGTIFTGADRTHPTAAGAMFTGYLFAENQTKNSLVASVEIDTLTGSVNSENASVTELVCTEEGIEYIYAPKAMPLAVNDSYNTIVNTFNYNITDKLNNEIIKISGLADGDYTVTFDEEYVLGTYSAAELAAGINIAVNENNPAQAAVNEAFNAILEKDWLQYISGQLARYKAFVLKAGIDLDDEAAVKAYLGDSKYREYTSWIASADERLNKIQTYREKAHSLSLPQIHTVTVKR